MNRTVRVLLRTNPEQAAAFAETARLFSAVFNEVCAYGWAHNEKNGVRLHHATYYPLKERYPALVSDLHCQARVKATEALRSVFVLRRRGRKVSAPRSAQCPPRFNKHTFKVDWPNRTVRLSTTQGRMSLPFQLLAYAEKYAGATVLTSDLLQRDGNWWLHIVVDLPAPEVVPNAAVVGVDLGIAQPAVTSNNRFLGKKGWRAVETRNFNLRRALQAKGTKPAKRHLRKMRRRAERFRRDCDHVLSKQIVEACPHGGTIILENLKDIRRRTKVRHGKQARRLHSWSFAQLKSFVRYKAEGRGITVVGVDPRHTSQMCSSCGHIARNNRRSRAWFQCRACGFLLHADLNGARNIAAKYHAAVGIPGGGGQPVNLPIVGSRAPHGSLTSCRL